MSMTDKNVRDGQKCPRPTKMSATDKNVRDGQKCPQRFSKQHYIPKYIIQFILATFYSQGSSWIAKCKRRTKMSAMDKNVCGGQKCPRWTKMSTEVP
jgi:hypothetical protein